MSSLPHPLAWLPEALESLDRQHLRRQVYARDGAGPGELTRGGQTWLNFASNDYLGLSVDPRLAAAAEAAMRQAGWGAGASPLVVGYTSWHAELERALAEFEGAEAALVFGSGYAANVGTICSLVERGDAVFSDELNHASIVDGCRLSRATVHVYPHGDLATLEKQLAASRDARRRLIVTDTLFSMHGDIAPLPQLAELAQRHGAMLMVDEAHATGVFGAHGRGLCEAAGVEDAVHIRIGTLSKALGCSGGFVTGCRELIQWLINRARPYIFSTAAPPANGAAALAALTIVREEPQRREQLLATAADVAEQLRRQGWNLGQSSTQILPLVIGDSQQALDLSAALRERGLWVPAIRPPSVRPGEACLRLCLTAGHMPAMIDKLLSVLGELKRGLS